MKNKDGFTLLEVIISIAALSIISVFILQMFIASSRLNGKAKDTDIAVNRAVTAIENFKKHSSLSDYLEADVFGDISENDGIITVRAYYDKSWEPLIAVSEDAKYCISMDISPIAPPQESGVTNGTLYAVWLYVEDMSLPESPLASLQTKKYFISSEEGV